MIDFIIKIYLIILALIFFASGQSDDLVLLISYDAFRPEYLERNVTPFMNDLRKKGSYAEYMRNVFPTKTFTNHHTISTGLYPQVHGVLGNSVYDVKLKKELNYTYTLFHYNEDILPIWNKTTEFGKSKENLSTAPVIPPTLKALKENTNSIPGSPISGSSAVSTRSSSDSYSSSSSTRQLLSSVPATNETPLHILDVKMCDDKQHSLDKAVHV